ncbi:MAG: hypothetical protein ABI597_00600 [Gammaproteobacteria bacterium]
MTSTRPSVEKNIELTRKALEVFLRVPFIDTTDAFEKRKKELTTCLHNLKKVLETNEQHSAYYEIYGRKLKQQGLKALHHDKNDKLALRYISNALKQFSEMKSFALTSTQRRNLHRQFHLGYLENLQKELKLKLSKPTPSVDPVVSIPSAAPVVTEDKTAVVALTKSAVDKDEMTPDQHAAFLEKLEQDFNSAKTDYLNYHTVRRDDRDDVTAQVSADTAADIKVKPVKFLNLPSYHTRLFNCFSNFDQFIETQKAAQPSQLNVGNVIPENKF